MKRLFLIGGTMGVGKTAVSRELKRLLPRAVMLDGDWCWDADPFVVTDETKQMVMENITFLLGQFLRCTEYENVIFCWVMHEQAIIDELLSRLDTRSCEVTSVSLTCEEEFLRDRLEKDVALGLRKPDVIARSVARLPLYDKLKTVKIDTGGLTVREIAGAVTELKS